MSDSALLFVYGSLRRGSDHAMSMWLAERACWQGRGYVQGRLYRVSWYPALGPGDAQVWGDIYRIPVALLPELDAYEDIRHRPDDEYRRECGTVVKDDGKCVQAWLYRYVKATTDLHEVTGGDWLQHDAE